MHSPEKSHTQEFAYFSALDGFRGFASLLILCFHSLFPVFSALWIGVPMFFVLSGFLITRILIQQKKSENFLKTFYLKRSLRIFPIYYLALLVSVVWGVLVQADLSKLPVFLVYLQNFTISSNVLPDYCNGIMNHTWSLSAEEIFYVFWPLLILVTPTQKIKALCIPIGLACLIFKFVLLTFFYNDLTSQFLQLSLVGNIDGLMAGSLLGYLSMEKEFFDKRIFPSNFFLLVLFLFIAVFSLNYVNFWNLKQVAIFKAALSVLTVFVSFFLIWFLSVKDSKGIMHTFLRTRFMQFTGKISYGIYLYHALVYGITASCVYHFQIQVDAVSVFLFEVLITYVIATLSWFWIEMPVLRLKNKFRYSKP